MSQGEAYVMADRAQDAAEGFFCLGAPLFLKEGRT
jgi:hypothetical protein